MKNKPEHKFLDWKEETGLMYDKSLSFAILILLFAFIVFPKIEVKPYEHKAKVIQTIETPPEIKKKIKPPKEVKPVIPLTVEETSSMAEDEDVEEVETIGPTTLDLQKPPPAQRKGTTPKFVVHDSEPIPLPGNPKPKYTDFARQSGLEGTVILRAEVFEDGTVGAVEIVKSLQSGEGGLDQQAIKAVKQWKFIPAKNQGKPVAVWVTFPVTFEL
ncbi:MAG: energy transducer TonB [Candidatus Cloacimonetes bacterium]|nr:energy transducer TonB [Candidatus Cloacimonadota bacterium]